MLNKTGRYIQRNCFWLVLFCHCLIFSGASLVWVSAPKLLKDQEERPSLFIPSYVYQDAKAPALQQPMPEQVPPNKPPEPAPPKEQKVLPTSKIGIEKPAITRTRPSFDISHSVNISRSPETEPVHLIGDKKIDRPLLTLLGKALTKHLVYPKSAIDLNVRGTSVIGFLLYPDGHITDIQLLRTSRAEVLDAAALAAANAIGPIAHVSQYLDKPKFMVIGIIFE